MPSEHLRERIPESEGSETLVRFEFRLKDEEEAAHREDWRADTKEFRAHQSVRADRMSADGEEFRALRSALLPKSNDLDGKKAMCPYQSPTVHRLNAHLTSV